jgi:tRNA G18 (ribose-2'-O)-methylase SpoU
MAEFIKITDITAHELDPYVRLTGAQLRNKLSPSDGIIIVESPVVIGTALDCGYMPISFLTDERLINDDVEGIIHRIKTDYPEVPIYIGERDLLREVTGFELTRGALSAMRRPALPSLSDVLKGAERVAILEEIADATNVGAIFRSAAALGFDAVLVTPTSCDPYSRRAIRVSMGTVFQIPWTRIGESASDWPSPGLELLREHGFSSAAMALCDRSVGIDDTELMNEKKLAIILGTEGTGLKHETIESADYVVKIPMFHGVDSLNVGAAGAVAFWQLSKKRRLYKNT